MNPRTAYLAVRKAGTSDPRDATLRSRDTGSLYHQVLFIYGTGMGIGLHLALLHLFMWRSVPDALFVIATFPVYSTLFLVLWQWVLPRFSHYSLSRRIVYQSLVSLVTFTVLSLVAVEVRALLIGGPSILQPYHGPERTLVLTPDTLRQIPLLYALVPIVPTVVICVIGFNQHWWRIFVLQGQQAELRELAVSAQLAALRAQVNPHFLFNSLNSIAQLITTDPVKAEACVERLGEIYRYLLHRAQAEFVTLADELRVAESYLEIERARFGDALSVKTRVDPSTRSVLLPSLILQPLVENAVKHGISPKRGGGCVTIEAQLEDGDLRLVVADTGVGVGDQRAIFENGVGLGNVRDRIVRLYGPEYMPQVLSRPGGGTAVTLRIPATREEV